MTPVQPAWMNLTVMVDKQLLLDLNECLILFMLSNACLTNAFLLTLLAKCQLQMTEAST